MCTTNRNLIRSIEGDACSDTLSDMGTNEESHNKPFLLKPAGKDYLWGGNRLNEDFAKGMDLSPLAETWECSTHPDGPSVIATGDFQGQALTDVIKNHPEYLGSHPKTEGGLPVLIKFIDAKQDLSVQVHPNDEYAGEHENGSRGKTEMWYVLDAVKDAKLIYGFYHDMDEETIRMSLADGTVEKYLQKVPVHKDDVFFIPAGQVHAVGSGTLLAEIQESSNLTYRLYDYGRVDKNGRPRELQIDKALEVVNLKGSSAPRQPMRVLKFRPGVADELLCRCRYFEVSRMLLNTESVRQMVRIQAGTNSFQVLLCTEGCGIFFWEDTSLPFYKGDCLFIPADSIPLRIHGKAQMLRVSC